MHSSGLISLVGRDLSKHFTSLRRNIGYCPQFDDALIDLLTVEEHLYYYARLKGVPKMLIKPMVEM